MDSKKPVILAVDDQPVILHIIVSELGDLYQVRPFTSGATALKYLEKQQADLALLDYEMPGMNGCEVMDRLRANPKTSALPVIFLTGAADSDTEAEVLGRGASDYIQKPIKALVLQTRVQMQLELAAYRNHMEKLVAAQTEDLRLANETLKNREDITLNLLAEVTDLRDHDTGGHIWRTTEMVRVMADALRQDPAPGYELSAEEAENLVNSAKLHDLGKIAMPDSILLKPGRPTAEELEIIRRHPIHSAELFDKYIKRMGNDRFLHMARDISLCHHEKWDGTGYPSGLKGEDIPLSGRITALADVYDALTAARPYKEPMPHDQAVALITGDSGTHFDPYLVSVFLQHAHEFQRIAQKKGGEFSES